MTRSFTYTRATSYLDDCLVFGIKPSLVRINRLLKLLGNPHRKNDFIHVVGTNGKTSTTIITAGILHGHGIPAGFHISPHITEYTERFWYCGKYISRRRFADLLTSIFPYIEEVNKLDLDGPMTQFEIIAAMSFKLAEMENLEVMVMEAGMGGRWDATNAADSKIVGLTGVDLEHTEILGSTIKEIAIEKVQVIKKHVLAATLSEDKAVIDVLKKHVRATDSKMFLYGKDFEVLKKVKNYLDGWTVDIKGINKNYKDLNIPLLGDYQPYNLALALVLSELYTSTFKKDIIEKDLKRSLLKLRIKGRFEILQKNPVVIADSSHNPAGIDNFVKNIEESFKERKKIIIFSVLKDKDYLRMIRSILPASSTIILTSSNTQRSLGIDELEKETVKIIKDIGKKGISVPIKVCKIDSISNSLKYALKIAESSDIICITGSITNLENIV